MKLAGRRGPVRDCNFAALFPDDTPAGPFETGRQRAAHACLLYQAALRTLELHGEFVLERAGRLNFRGDHASLDGKPIHAVMTQALSLAAEAQPWIYSPLPDLVESGCIIAVNGPYCSAISDKIVLALLSEAAEGGKLDADDAALVRSALPWTKSFRATSTVGSSGSNGGFAG